MGRKRYQPEQIIGYLREAVVMLAKGGKGQKFDELADYQTKHLKTNIYKYL